MLDYGSQEDGVRIRGKGSEHAPPPSPLYPLPLPHALPPPHLCSLPFPLGLPPVTWHQYKTPQDGSLWDGLPTCIAVHRPVISTRDVP